MHDSIMRLWCGQFNYRSYTHTRPGTQLLNHVEMYNNMRLWCGYVLTPLPTPTHKHASKQAHKLNVLHHPVKHTTHIMIIILLQILIVLHCIQDTFMWSSLFRPNGQPSTGIIWKKSINWDDYFIRIYSSLKTLWQYNVWIYNPDCCHCCLIFNLICTTLRGRFKGAASATNLM